MTRPAVIGTVLAAALASGCSEHTRLPDRADVGPRPTLVEPVRSAIPTVNIAPARGWQDGEQPAAATGLQVVAFASGLDHPRWLLVLPNGDVLVAESNAPPRPQGSEGLRGWVMKQVMGRAGAGVPSANRITLLRDADGDGRAEIRSTLLQGLNSPFGMALVGDRLYVAATDGVIEFPFTPGQTRIDAPGRRLTELPAGERNHHWTKSLIASPDGRRLYATVGSNSNVAENGLAAEDGRAAIWEIDRLTGAKRVFATGLRNPNGMAWLVGADGSTVLWTVVNERDEIGSDLVPDYLTSVRDGAFYGWPYSWYGPNVDHRVQPPQPDLVARATVPDFALGAHVAALGLAASGRSPVATRLEGRTGNAGIDSPAPSGGAGAAGGRDRAAGPAPGGATVRPSTGVFIGLHGSWNRRPLSGYKVVYVPFAEGRPQGMPIDVLTGFVDDDGKARGRPVGVAIDAQGALLVADDVGNRVWRVTPR